MSATFDRDKAREILRAHGALQSRIVEAFVEDLLSALEECVQPPRAFVVHSEEEFRARIDAEAKLARIAALCDQVKPGWQQVVSLVALRAVLEGTSNADH